MIIIRVNRAFIKPRKADMVDKADKADMVDEADRADMGDEVDEAGEEGKKIISLSYS